jgi:glucose-1-phosphate thymidylyltransferase
MKVIILAGGFGTRTNGILNGIPKTLIVSSNGKPILYFMLNDLLKHFLARDILIITNELYYGVIKKYLNKNFTEHAVKLISNRIIKNKERQGALGDLLYALENGGLNLGKDESLLVMPSDTLYWKAFTFEELKEFEKNNREDFIVAYRDIGSKNKIRGRFGCCVLNEKGEVIDFIEKPEKPPSTYAALPVYIYRSKQLLFLYKYRKENGNMDSPGMILPYLLKKKQIIKGMMVGKEIIDAGTPEDIEKAKKY